jgi:secretion/DNA translocation related TadE-like protein
VTGRRRSQNGSATVLAMTVGGCLLAVTWVVLVLAGLVVEQRRVEAAADLAALAGAAAAGAGQPACPAAAAVARANQATLGACQVRGRIVELETLLEPVWLPGDPTLRAQARAGPG